MKPLVFWMNFFSTIVLNFLNNKTEPVVLKNIFFKIDYFEISISATSEDFVIHSQKDIKTSKTAELFIIFIICSHFLKN